MQSMLDQKEIFLVNSSLQFEHKIFMLDCITGTFFVEENRL